MIHGGVNWNDRESAYFIQSNNPTEQLLKKVLQTVPEQYRPGWLESCGPESSITCQAAVGRPVGIQTPGGFQPQPGEVLIDWFEEPANYPIMRAIPTIYDPATIPGNRVPQWYAPAVKAVFGNECRFMDLDQVKPERVADILRTGLREKRSFQPCWTAPGHYFALVAWDDETDEGIFNDTWPERFPDGNGFNRRMPLRDLVGAIRPFVNIYFP